MGPNRCQSWILGLSGKIHTQTTVMDYLRQKIDSLTPTDTQDFESKLEKSHVFRMKGRQHGVILIKKQTTFIPQRRVLLKELTEWVPYFLRSFFICIIGEIFHFPLGTRFTYSPKESSLKNSPRGPIGRVLSLPCIIVPQRRVP